MSVTLEDASKYLPPGLAAPDLAAMYGELQRLDQGIKYFSPHKFDFRLQGDVLNNASFVVIRTNDECILRHTRVMILSNTCDIASENTRRESVYVTVAPLIRSTKWREGFAKYGMSHEDIENKLTAARAHRISSVFVVPAGQGLEEESIVLFSNIQSIPRACFDGANPERLAVLSQAAHWLLSLKLSIHFCRLQEGVTRQAA